MSVEGQTFYPGESATPRQFVLLADEYHRAAVALMEIGRRGQPLSRAPYRLVAIHAIELYLNALVLASGHPPDRLRGLHHNLVARLQCALRANLHLRTRTVRHLEMLSETREYLTTRYDPAGSVISELNRLSATLAEVAEKVSKLLAEAPNQLAPQRLSSPVLSGAKVAE